MRCLYPEIEPYRSGHLKVSPIHTLYWEESGNPTGTPALFLHGGPGSGTKPFHRRFFNPETYRIILFDQRGCGKSTPLGELRENTTDDLIEDIEKLRNFLQVDRWVVFGGSWGSTLALAYAIKHPSFTKALILRGIFLCRNEDLSWFLKSGASMLFPDVWEEFIKEIPLEERGDLIKAYYKRLTSSDALLEARCAHAWAYWEAATLRLIFDQELVNSFIDEEHALSLSRIESHYFVHNGFFPKDNYLIEEASKIRHIPTYIIHGRYDVICPLKSAWDLYKALPHSDFSIIANAGHAAIEEGITDALIRASNACQFLPK